MIIDKPQISQIPALRQLWKQAFGDPDAFLDSFFTKGFSPNRCRCLTIDGNLAAALYWFDCQWGGKKLAYLYAIATDTAYRRHGLCRALMEDCHRHLQGLGYAGTALVPQTASLFALYEKLGYRPFCPMETVTVEAGSAPEPIHPICWETYETMQQAFLPDNSLVHTGSALSFLSTFGQFYAGNNAAFCVSREEDTLLFQEFLGDPTLLPGIVCGLKAEKATVRLSGGSTPFAMYHSLTGDSALPSYLGIALD